jgi:hypothetical protein
MKAELEIRKMWLMIKMLTGVMVIGISTLLSVDIILYSMISGNIIIGLLSLIMIIPILQGVKMYLSADAEMREVDANGMAER